MQNNPDGSAQQLIWKNHRVLGEQHMPFFQKKEGRNKPYDPFHTKISSKHLHSSHYQLMQFELKMKENQ